PGNLGALCRLAISQWRSGEIKNAIAELNIIASVRDASPWRAEALIALGNIEFGRRRLKKASRYYSRVLDLDISESYAGERGGILAHAYCGMGSVHGEEGAVFEAMELYAKAIECAPEHAPSHANLALCNERLHRYADAIRGLGMALRLRPDNSEWWSFLGDIYRDSGQPLAARLSYLRA